MIGYVPLAASLSGSSEQLTRSRAWGLQVKIDVALKVKVTLQIAIDPRLNYASHGNIGSESIDACRCDR